MLSALQIYIVRIKVTVFKNINHKSPRFLTFCLSCISASSFLNLLLGFLMSILVQHKLLGALANFMFSIPCVRLSKVFIISVSFSYPVEAKEVRDPLHTVGLLQWFMLIFTITKNTDYILAMLI
jgi:hypothetical protein